MKFFFIVLFTAFPLIAFANEYRTMDIINNSDTLITITYDECQADSPSPSSPFTMKNCVEKTTMLRQKGSGSNYLIYHNRKENEASPNLWILKKISSTLGEQQFASFKSFTEFEQMGQEDICYAILLPSLVGANRNIILDNLGTNRFYCHRLDLW